MKKLILLLIIFLGCQERTSLDCGGVWGGEGILDECGICNGLDINNNGECDYHCFECTNSALIDSSECETSGEQWFLNQTIQDECGVCNGLDLVEDGNGECDENCDGDGECGECDDNCDGENCCGTG